MVEGENQPAEICLLTSTSMAWHVCRQAHTQTTKYDLKMCLKELNKATKTSFKTQISWRGEGSTEGGVAYSAY